MKVSYAPFALVFVVRSFWWLEWIPGMKGVRATTNGYVIQLGPNVEEGDLEHELVHVEQYSREPFIHPFLYFWENYRHGYRGNKYEGEAYAVAGKYHDDSQSKGEQKAS